MKIDPYNHEKRYKVWKAQVLEQGIQDISKQNSDIILQYVSDMEHGLNVSSKSVKGGRSYIRLNTRNEKTGRPYTSVKLTNKGEDLVNETKV